MGKIKKAIYYTILKSKSKIKGKTMKEIIKLTTLMLTLLLFTACVRSGGSDDNTTDISQDTDVTAETETETTAASITHNGTTYGFVTSPYTGKVWLDRNLGAAQVCTSFDDTACYGDYYQWGRNFDGHEDSMSGTTTTQATDVTSVGHGDFIINDNGRRDWASVDATGATRMANWSKTDGSSVCPVGFRVPSFEELKAETLDNGVTNRDTAFSNFLALPSAGYRYSGLGTFSRQGLRGYVWTSSVNGSYSYFVGLDSDILGFRNGIRASAISVRCLKD